MTSSAESQGVNDSIGLNPAYSTTRNVTRNAAEKGKDRNGLFLSDVKSRRGVGGMRIQGYYKCSSPSKPLITVITVVLDDVAHIEKAILSVMGQSYDNVEFIILDGGSSDGTLDIIRKYEESLDYWVSEPDSGVYDAMNKAVGVATGDWIYFLGSDDVLLDHSLGEIAPRLRDKCAIYYGDVYMSRRHCLYDGQFSSWKLAFNNICHQAIFYPKIVFEKYSFDTRYKILSDYYLNIKCHGDSSIKFSYVPVLIAIYNDHSGISANMRDHLLEEDKIKLVKDNFGYAVYLCLAIDMLCQHIRCYVVLCTKKIGIYEVVKRIYSK